MSLFGKLFGGNQKEHVAVLTLAHTRGFHQRVVGEASYQRAISKIVGGKSKYSAKHKCTALLVCDNANKYDSQAVEVRIDGQLVGYLPKEDAVKYRKDLGLLDPDMPASEVRAKIVGGWRNEESEGHFGVKLNLKWPLFAIKPVGG